MKSLLSYYFLILLVCVSRASAQPYTSFITGLATDVHVLHSYGVCLMGGATENDQAMRWFLQQANGGNIVVLRATGGNGYNAYLFSQLGVPVHSVETLVVPNSNAANDPYVAQKVRQAEAIWIAGGNQATYLQQWSGTALDSALREVVQVKRITIGGTSAGMAILGEGINTAIAGSVTSSQSLNDPFHPFISLQWGGFSTHPLLSKTITDTHFDNPDRRGRLSVFLARLQTQHGSDVRGLACDEYTAVCIDSSGIARVFGEWPQEDDNAYFVQINCQPPTAPETLSQGSPLTWNRGNQALKVYRVKGDTAGASFFNVANWTTGQGGSWLHWWVVSGNLFSGSGSPVLPCTITGLHHEEVQATSSLLFPNPFKSTLQLDKVPFSCKIIHYSGKVMFTMEPNMSSNVTIHTADWPPGLYFFEQNGQAKKLLKMP